MRVAVADVPSVAAADRERYFSNGNGRVAMRTIKHVTICIVFLASAVLFARSVEGSEGAGQALDSRHMRCVLKITADAAVMPLDFGVVESLLRSDAVAGRAARDVLDDKPNR